MEEGVKFCVTALSSKIFFMQITSNNCNGLGCLAIQDWKTHLFLSHVNGISSFQTNLFEESTAFTADIEQANTARIRNFQGGYMTVDPETFAVSFQPIKGDYQLWSVNCIGKKSKRDFVGATVLESVAFPKLFLSIK